ncbi:hypothetical protein PIB30_054467 [Stylosanthes scabra]|uniref:Uncharacterized protein n=1 Tax=Stylosanthes scabra TaxID=79078 RepID=A0ABU6WH28_9FABA|nr:hypothetical protein [Stylosanthes scabra]
MKETVMKDWHTIEEGWMKENMEKIGGTWGRVIKTVEDAGGHFNSFRVLVESNTGPSIQAFIDVVLDQDTFKLYVREVGDLRIYSETEGIRMAGEGDGMEDIRMVCPEKRGR